MTAMIGDSSSSAHGRGKRSARSAGERRSGEIRDVVAMPRLAQADRQATAVLMPLLDIPQAHRVWVAAAFLLGPSPATRSAARTPPGAPCSTPSISPNLTRRCSRSSATRRRGPRDRQERHPSADGKPDLPDQPDHPRRIYRPSSHRLTSLGIGLALPSIESEVKRIGGSD